MLLVLACLAQAIAQDAPATVRVGEVAVGRYDRLDAAFEIEPKLGRAWVSLTIDDGDTDVPANEEELFLVPGLRYDAGRRALVLDSAAGPIDCGAVRRGRSVTEGGCRLVAVREQREIDDGFGRRRRTIALVRLELPAR
jgi:hypothetical protein